MSSVKLEILLSLEPRLSSVLPPSAERWEFDPDVPSGTLENGPQHPETLERIFGQATKGSRWIPWHTEAMKDVVTCDKSRGAGSTL